MKYYELAVILNNGRANTMMVRADSRAEAVAKSIGASFTMGLFVVEAA